MQLPLPQSFHFLIRKTIKISPQLFRGWLGSYLLGTLLNAFIVVTFLQNMEHMRIPVAEWVTEIEEGCGQTSF